MRRSICFTEPSIALAGQLGTWKFCHTPATSLPKGTRVKFDPLIKARPIDWEIPQINPKNKKSLIWLELPSGKTIFAKETFFPDQQVPAYEFILTEEVNAGETFSILMGAFDHKEENGIRAQSITQRRRPFNLYIDPKGKGDYKEAEVFNIDVRGNRLSTIRIFAPSVVSKNKRFDVLVRFEDEYGNLTSYAPEGTLIELSYENLRENLNWKLFVPETGFIVLPNLYFNEPGLYRIQLLNAQNKQKFFSSPIKCFADTDRNLYWGLLHGESEKIDSGENIDSCLRHFRDEKGLQFFASSNFENSEETDNDTWKLISQQITEYNEESRFTTFLGMQWFGDPKIEGLRQLIYWKDGKPLLRKKDSKHNTLKKIYKTHTPKELLAIPSFTMGKGLEYNFDDFTPEFERVVEIYNAWGSSECTEKQGNLRPITTTNGAGITETEVGSIRKALNRNCRFGFVAGGWDDRGVFESFYENDQEQYSSGLTAIYAIEQTREALLQGLYNRVCYATTGARMVIGFFIAGAHMGSELSTKVKPGLAYNRYITGFAHCTAPIKEITFIRNGEEYHRLTPKGDQHEFIFDDTDPLSKLTLPSTDERPPFVYYYMRVVQEDGHIGWASPIWIDFVDVKGATLTLPKKNKKS